MQGVSAGTHAKEKGMDEGRIYFLYGGTTHSGGKRRRVLLLYEGCGDFLHRKNDSLSAEGARFLLRYYGIKTEALLLLEDTAVRGEDWLYDYARDTRYMGILTDRPGEQEEVADFLYEEYGIVLQVADRAGKWHIPDNTSCLFVAGENGTDSVRRTSGRGEHCFLWAQAGNGHSQAGFRQNG